MAKTVRRDAKGRVLRTGESQDKTGKYIYKYVDNTGKTKYVYSWRLVETDTVPKSQNVRKVTPLRELEKEIKRDLEDGINTTDKKMTVCELYQKYIDINQNVVEGTQVGREAFMNILKNDALGASRIDSVKPSDAKAWIVRMSEKGYAFHTINNYKRTLKAIFYMAVQDDILRKNPFVFQTDSVIKDDTEHKVALTKQQEEAYLTFLQMDNVYYKLYDMVVVILHTGLRISELCGLTVNDLDFENRTITVSHQLKKFKSEYRITDPKTDSGNRTIYMDATVYEILKNLVEKARFSKFTVEGHSGFLFRNRKGLPYLASDYSGMMNRSVEKYKKTATIELPSIMTPHTLRHTFCTNFALQGMNPKALQYVMGHKNITMTLEYYTHVTTDSVIEEMKKYVA